MLTQKSPKSQQTLGCTKGCSDLRHFSEQELVASAASLGATAALGIHGFQSMLSTSQAESNNWSCHKHQVKAYICGDEAKLLRSKNLLLTGELSIGFSFPVEAREA